MSVKLNAISNITPYDITINKQNRTEEGNVKFAHILKNALKQVDKTQHEANLKRDLLVAGKITDLHDVMITAKKASLTVEAAVQVQQKVIDAYNEMMRMQI